MAEGRLIWVVGDLRTGQIWRETQLSGSWKIGFDGPDEISGLEFPGAALIPGTNRPEWPDVWEQTMPARSFAACFWRDDLGEQWLAGGPIWSQEHSEATGVIQASAAGLLSYYDHRLVLPVLAAGQLAKTVSTTFTGAELGLIAKQLISQAHSWTNGALPVDLPSDASLGGAGVAHTRTYEGGDLKNLGSMLENLRGVDKGPEMQFRPRRDSANRGYLRWQMLIGTSVTSQMIHQTGADWVFDATPARRAIRDIKTKNVGGQMASDVHATGRGDGDSKPMARASSSYLTDIGYPLMQASVSGSDAETAANLQAYADGELAPRQAPVQTTTIDFDAQEFFHRYRGIAPGDMAILRVRDHPALAPRRADGSTPTEEIRMRILSLAGSTDSTSVTVTMQDRQGRA